MVDCGATKCFQERKNIKKELLSWTKKIPLLIGLEEVTKVVLGKRLSKRVLDITYSEDGRGKPVEHTDCIKDWEPQENCTFCDKKSKFFIVDSPKYEHRECPNVDGVSNDCVGGDYTNMLKPAPQAVMHDQPDSVTTETECCDESCDPDQPLDLSISSQKKRDESLNSSIESSSSYNTNHQTDSSPNGKQNSVQLKVPTLEGKFPSSKKREINNGQKRVYTEDELNAAVSDIRSGKIGTRRAAALYGIPRSTLRNKMCRIDLAESKCSSPLPASAMTNSNAPPAKLTVRDMLQAGLGHDRVGEGLTDTMDCETEVKPYHGDSWTKDEEVMKVRHKHDLSAGIERPFGMPPLFYNSQYMLECERAFRSANPYAYDMKLPYLQDLIWRYAQERMDDTAGLPTLQELKEYASRSRTSNTDSLALDLQIPTLPSSSEYYVKGLNSSPLRGSEAQEADHVSPSTAQGILPARIDDTLKDILSKTISEKMKSQVQPPNAGVASMDKSKHSGHDNPSLPSPPSQPVFPGSNLYDSFYMMSNGYPCSNGHAAAPSGLEEPPYKKQILSVKPINHKGHLGQTKLDMISKLPKEGIMMTSCSSGDDQKPLKKTRPKRGQYRKYNHELLMEAVRAVQRGEMSVHRAGSYYGVPHSTLEYKVKERHLLRQKKPREPRKKALIVNDMASVESSSSSVKASVPLSPVVSRESPSDSNQSSGNMVKLGNSSINSRLEKDATTAEVKPGTSSSQAFRERPSDEVAMKYFGDLGNDPIQHATQSLQASLLLGSLGASGTLPNFPLPNSHFPLGFGWQNPLLNGNLPFPLPDATLAASLYGAGGLGINTSASELLKKLQQKVQAETSSEHKGNEKESSATTSVKPVLDVAIAIEKQKSQKEANDRNLSSMIEVGEK